MRNLRRSCALAGLLCLAPLPATPAERTADAAPQRVLGFGGVFFRAAEPEQLAQWYARHLGVSPVPTSYDQQPWQQQAGPTVFALFPKDSTYFGRMSQSWMINFRVADLDAMVAQLRAAGIRVRKPERCPNGRFARLQDPEGNPIELWEPVSAAESVTAEPALARGAVIEIVAKVRRADYEGDRAALARLHDELGGYVDDASLAPRVLYWRGFARWRSALNGFSDAADPAGIASDLQQCIEDFRAALARDPAFVEAKIGAASCLVNASFIAARTDRARARDLYAESMATLTEAQAAAPDNPRLLWVQGANEWYAPSGRGGGHEVAIATYRRGLELARRAGQQARDPLHPAWGEAELLMNLAFASLHGTAPELDAAEEYAERALALVPYWHYVKDNLLPAIRRARTGLSGESGPAPPATSDAPPERPARPIERHVASPRDRVRHRASSSSTGRVTAGS